MPRGDGTGPTGLGPMTGRAAGYCAGYSVPGYMNPRPGYGYGMGFGRGGSRGFRRGGFWGGRFQPMVPFAATPYSYGTAYTQPTPQEERSFLENQMKALQGQLDAVKQRLDELTTQMEEKSSAK